MPFAIAFLIGVICLPGAALAARPDSNSNVRELPGRTVEIRAGNQSVHTRDKPRNQAARGLSDEPTADIQVTYLGFQAEAQASFEAAVDVWERTVVSNVPIHVAASWLDLGPGVLGSAGPASFYLLDDGYAYPAALAEAICVCERKTGSEIVANFNSAFSGWYLGTDGIVPAGQYDFYSVVLHELGHGLGFLSSFGVSGSVGFWGLSNGSTYIPLRFDSYEMGSATGGAALTNEAFYPNDSEILKAELTDGSVFFAGPNAVAAAGGRVQLYAPDPWNSGSSNSHVDETAFAPGTANALMTPMLNPGEALDAPGPIMVAMLQDIGWTIPTPPPAPANDVFSSSSQLSSFPFHSAVIDNTSATLDPGEPQPTCNPVANTVWYRLQPAKSYSLRLRAVPTHGLNVIMAMYEGTAIDTLTEVTCADAALTGGEEVSIVNLVKGHTYYVQIGGFPFGVVTGTFNLHAKKVATAPVNDNIANAAVKTLGSVSQATTTAATFEPTEPAPSCATAVGKTVWYRFDATQTRKIVAKTAGSNFDTVIAAYVGPDPASLVPVACNDNRPIDTASKLKFKVFAGNNYWFQVGGTNGVAGLLMFTLKKA